MNTFQDHLATVITDEEFEIALRIGRSHRDTSVQDWLYEYEEEELEHSYKCYKTQKSEKSIDIKNFFEDLRLFPPYCDRLPGIPVWVLLPYYNHIIVWLEPYRSSKTFEKIYGISPGMFADLCGSRERPGKIIPILNASPPAFAGLKHFERILELEPPTMWRDFFFQRAILGDEEFLGVRREANEILPKKLTGRERFASLRGTGRGTVKDLAISCYCEVSSLGGRELVRKVVNDAPSSKEMVDLLFYYSLATYDSLVSPIGGNYPCTREELCSLVESCVRLGTTTREEFPVEIGKNLIEYLNIPLPTDPSVCQWWISEARDIWRPARKALKDLEAALAKPSGPNIENRALSFESIWQSIADEIYSSRRVKAHVGFALERIGVIGSILGIVLPGFPGIMASLIGATATTANVFDMQKIYSRVSRPRHLVSVIDLHQYLKKHPVEYLYPAGNR